MEARLHWRNERREEMLKTPWREVNGQGVVSCITNGTDFRVQLRSNSFVDTYLDYIKLKWKMTDLRSQRGPYVALGRG